MKKIIILIYFLPFFGLAQTDVGYLYTAPSTPLYDSLIFPYELTNRGATVWKKLPIKLRKVMDTKLKMGLSEAYTPESDIGAANAAGASVRVLLYQTILTADITEEERLMLSNFITQLEGPGTYVPPTGPTEPPPPPVTVYTDSIDDRDVRIKYSTGWVSYNNTMYHKKTAKYNDVKGASFTFSFTGNKIQWWAERRFNHGSAKVEIFNENGKLRKTANPSQYNARSTNISEMIYEDTVKQGKYTMVVTMEVINNITDYIVVQSNTPIVGSVDPPPPPTGDVINVYPGANLEQILLSAANKTIKLNPGNYVTNPLFIPVNVNVLCDNAVISTNTFGDVESKVKVGIFNLNSGSRTAANQSITGCIFDGKNVAYSGVMVYNRDGVTLQNLVVRDTNFNGVWCTACSNFKLLNSEFMNAAWSSGSYLSGALNIANVSNSLIQYNRFLSNKNSKGTGIEALWKKTELTNIKILNNKFDLSHHNPWNNGTSKNFAMELHDTYYRGLEIAYNEFQNEISLASHLPGNGAKTWVHHNTGNLENDTYFIEAICDDLEVNDNNISGCAMFSANMQENSKWKNHVYRNNTFASSGKVDWGAIFLFGKAGVQNVRIENNTISRAGNVLVKFMGPDQTGVQIIGAN